MEKMKVCCTHQHTALTKQAWKHPAARLMLPRVAETELVEDDDLQQVEEALEVEKEDGITLEPFNLAQERRDGYFDEGGHYVEHRNKDEEDEEKDAWLATSRGEHCVLGQ